MASQDWEKRVRELWPEESVASDVNRWRALRLAEEVCRHAADARAEEIAEAIENQRADHGAEQRGWIRGLRDSAFVARSFISKKKTREQVLEEALGQMPCSCGGHMQIQTMPPKTIHRNDCALKLAQRALEWRGDA